jgi:hypothetical protein
LFVKEGIGNGEQGTGGFRWGFIPKREEGTGKRKQEKLFAVPYSLFAYLMKHTTYGSGGLLLPDREQEIGKTVPCSLFPVPFFDESACLKTTSKTLNYSPSASINPIT